MSELAIKPPEAARHPVHDIAQAHNTKSRPRRFTAVSIGALKPRAQRFEVTDPGCAGLQLTIEPTGCKSWMFRFYWQGKRQRQVLGHWPDLGLARARDLAGAARTLLERGIDPRAAGLLHGSTARAGEASSEATDKHSVRFLAHEYMTHYVNPRLRRPDHVLQAIRSLICGQNYFSEQVSARLVSGYLRRHEPAPMDAHPRLTERERQVLTHVALGESNKRVALALRLSVKTVEMHRANVMRKLELHNSASVTLFAVRNGLVPAQSDHQTFANAPVAATGLKP